MTSLALRRRSSRGLRLIWMRPLLRVVLVPSMPMKEERLATAGSFRITRARDCCAWAMASKETDWGASDMPRITPVSCTGKKPLGMAR
jgi:hypothetical protein